MALNYVNLDENTRKYMIQELDLDEKTNNLYYSTRLNERGTSSWKVLLREGIISHDDDWIANQLIEKNCLCEYEQSRGKTKRVPCNAAFTLSEGEFNRLYVRGLCLRAINEGIREVQVYRGKGVTNPRNQSESLIGQKINPKDLLEDLRNSQGFKPSLGIPSGPNSGLTIRLVQ